MDFNPYLDGGHHHIIVAIDYFTKRAEAMLTIKGDGQTVAHFVFNQTIVQFGISKEIVMDHDSHFQNKMIEKLSLKLGFKHDHSSSHYP